MPEIPAEAVVHMETINGRAFQVWRIGGDPNMWQWHMLGIRALHTEEELALPAWQQPTIHDVLAFPIQPVGAWVGAHFAFCADPQVTDGWIVKGYLGRETLGYAATFAEMAQLAAKEVPARV